MAVLCYTVAIGEALTVGLQAQGVRVAGGGSGGQADRHGVEVAIGVFRRWDKMRGMKRLSVS